MRGLQGKRVIVTGGGSGIGREVCKRFAEEGSEVAVFDLNADGAAETVSLIEANGGKPAPTRLILRIALLSMLPSRRLKRVALLMFWSTMRVGILSNPSSIPTWICGRK